ncbi:MAG: glutamine amidotransferase family protein [Proteobacteria bacterium]|nr:glutamine amidotransferase family protein [Pseudomonadota bacterium]
MCGIVGLLVKNPGMRSELGELMMPMLLGMTERGPDSAGLAVFTDPVEAGRRKLSLYAGTGEFDWGAFEQAARQALDKTLTLAVKVNHAVLDSGAKAPAVRKWVREHYPQLYVLSAGTSIDLYKDVGLPAEVAERYDFAHLQGTHLVGHTRMATESAVTPDRAHPFTAGEDFCLVHNGSLSNPGSIQRKLKPLGIAFETDNDTEAACRFLEWRMREGDDLETALQKGFDELDGFYTFLMGTKDEIALVRDAFACKPAIVAETDDYVAISSEFRSLAQLPDIKNARIFEPKPEEIYVWRV